METETVVPEQKVKSEKHITIRGKPICRCHFSKEQFVKLVGLIQDRWTCTYASDDPKLNLVFESVKSVVKDPSTVEIKDGSCTVAFGGVPAMSVVKIPTGATLDQMSKIIAAQLSCPPPVNQGRNQTPHVPGLPPAGSVDPDKRDDDKGDDGQSFAA